MKILSRGFMRAAAPHNPTQCPSSSTEMAIAKLATLHFTPLPSSSSSSSPFRKNPNFSILKFPGTRRRCSTELGAYRVVIEQGQKKTELEVEADETILSKALDSGLDVPYDCKLGVCMTCPARLVSGTVDQSEGMLSEDVVERGYALLCSAYPKSDCRIQLIPEDELLALQLATAND